MSDIAGPYSSLKILHHPERIAQLRRGEQIVPTQVQIILSDLCNHSCVPAGTLIDLPDGKQCPIEQIVGGDVVLGPDGQALEVIDTGSRIADGIYRIRAGNRELRVTGDHPILTQDGWKVASEIKAGRDCAVVRLRMRESCGRIESDKGDVEQVSGWPPMEDERVLRCEAAKEKSGEICLRSSSERNGSDVRLRMRRDSEVESEGQVLGKVHPRPLENSQTYSLRGVHQDSAQDGGLSRSPSMQVRLRGASEVVQENRQDLLGGLPEWSHRKVLCDVRGEQKACCGTDDEQQSNERPRNCTEGTENVGGSCRPIEVGDEVYGVAIANEPADQLYRARSDVVQSQESRLSRRLPKQSNRIDRMRSVQLGANHRADNRELRNTNDTALQQVGVAVSCGVQEESPQEDTARTGANPAGLCIAGIELERDLVLRPIDSVERIDGEVEVFNIECPPTEAYIANGFAVHNCSFCSYRWDGYSSSELFTLDAPLAKFGHNNPIRMMPTEKAKEIIDDCVEIGVLAAQWTGGGEITVHPDHVEIMKYALDKGLECALVSNGELFRDGHIENLLRFKWVRFSIDAGTPETYGSIRSIPASRMNRVLDNIAALVAARHSHVSAGNECDLIIGIGFVVTKENYKEVVQCAEMAKALGVDNMRISAVFQPDDNEYFKDIHGEAFALCKQAESFSDDTFTVFNNYSERVQDLADKHPDYSFCGYQQLVSYVGADLNLYRCCVTSYSNAGLIGSLKNQRFKDLWESEQKRRDFEGFDARGCPRCMFNGKNRTILYAIDTSPRHANFV